LSEVFELTSQAAERANAHKNSNCSLPSSSQDFFLGFATANGITVAIFKFCLGAAITCPAREFYQKLGGIQR
jgi:uncharacterized protein YmfQ (DUF2313 family)